MRTFITSAKHLSSRPPRLWLLFMVLQCGLLPGCFVFHRHRNTGMAAPVNPGDQPDKILYDKAENEIVHGRFDVGRLTLQTLINTYPDSEFLSKAKLAIADSYFRQGGISGLTQAEAEYKDFITFFPTAPEAPLAEYRAGMAHFRLMGKEDRDTQEAGQAEAEFKVFLQKYPDSQLMPVVKARLREVQEILAEGDYDVAKFYYARGDSKAAESRLEEILSQYPNFSRGDQVLWFLGQSLDNLKKPQQAAPYYARIITAFPLSPHADDAKDQLKALHYPIPQPTRAILARAEADAARHSHQGLLHQAVGNFSSVPDFSATLHGPVYVGGAPPPIPVQMAKEQPASAVGKLSAQTVGEGGLNSAKADAPNIAKPPAPASSPTPSDTPAATPNASAATPNSEASQGTTPPDPSKTTKQDAHPASDQSISSKKKKGHLHFLKKLFPF